VLAEDVVTENFSIEVAALSIVTREAFDSADDRMLIKETL
jgi:hypothetical protein